MKKLSLTMLCGAVALACSFLLNVESAHAIKQFKDEFDKKYVKKTPGSTEEKSLAEAVATAKCNVCHSGKSKKDRNAYGQELAKLLDKKADKDNATKIQESLQKVETMPSDPTNPSAPTFGDLIKQGKLPGGEEAAQ